METEKEIQWLAADTHPRSLAIAVPYETEPWRVRATSRSCQRWHRTTLSPKQTRRTQSSASEDKSGCGVPDQASGNIGKTSPRIT